MPSSNQRFGGIDPNVTEVFSPTGSGYGEGSALGR
jgi:hypothetical protein